MKNSLELMEDRFFTLPEISQEAIRRFDYDGNMKKIHAKHRLHIDQSYTLEQLIADVIFGEIRPQDLIEKIKEGLRLDEEKAKELTFEINSMILIPIQDLMKVIDNEKNEL